MKTTRTLLLLSLLSTGAYAGPDTPAPVTLLQIYGTPSQNFSDVFVSNCPTSGGALTGCNTSSPCDRKTGFVIAKSSAATFKELYTAALSARLSGTAIGLLGTGMCTSNGLEILAEIWFGE